LSFSEIFRKILWYSFAGAGLYTFLLIGIHLLGFNPLGRSYSPLQAMFVPLVVGGSIAHFHYKQVGISKMLEKGIFGLGVGFFSPLIYAVILWVFLSSNPELVNSYLMEAKSFLMDNKELFVRFSGEEEFELTRKNLELTQLSDIIMDDVIKKYLVGVPFTILFLLLFFALPNYFRRPKILNNGK
jgi:hypothetical protein